MLKLGELGETSFGIVQLGELGLLGELWNVKIKWVR